MAGTIGDRLDERRRPIDEREDPVGELDVGHFVAAADVVDLAGAAAFDQQVERAAMVLDVQPVADVEAVAVERQRQVDRSALVMNSGITFSGN